MRRDRSDVLRELVALPGPASPDARETWARLDEPARAALRRAATDPVAAAAIHEPARLQVVRELAVRRAATRPTDVVVPVVTGLFVLSTVWGFGRAAFPAAADAWLVAGLVALGVTLVAGRRRILARRRAATTVVRAVDGVTGRPSDADP